MRVWWPPQGLPPSPVAALPVTNSILLWTAKGAGVAVSVGMGVGDGAEVTVSVGTTIVAVEITMAAVGLIGVVVGCALAPAQAEMNSVNEISKTRLVNFEICIRSKTSTTNDARP